MNASARDKIKLFLQRLYSYLFIMLLLYPIGLIWLKFVRRYKISELHAVRKKMQALKNEINGPLLICPNHLTFLDPILIPIALESFTTHALQFHTLPWNIPKKSHANNLLFRFVYWIGKTIPIDREASTEIKNHTMNVATYVLSRGEYVLAFPEGTRSKSGRVDQENFSYGVGRLLRAIPNAHVLCVYLRGDSQREACNFPSKGEVFSCALRLIKPQTEFQGLRAERDLSRQVIANLAEMERDYFTNNHLGQ